MEELTPYERQRQINIEQNNARLDHLVKPLGQYALLLPNRRLQAKRTRPARLSAPLTVQLRRRAGPGGCDSDGDSQGDGGRCLNERSSMQSQDADPVEATTYEDWLFELNKVRKP
jgi:hypothetical protein